MEEYSYVVNVDCVVIRDGEYLVIERGADEEHASGMLGFPGGKIEQRSGDENVIEQTAVREVDEEVGVGVGNVDYVLSTTFEADDGTQCLNIVTLCEYERGKAHPRSPDEVAAVYWFSPDEIRERNDVPEYIQEYVEQVEEFRSTQ